MRRKKGWVPFSQYMRQKRAEEYGVTENFTPQQRGRVKRQFDKKCFRCGSTKKLHLDHHWPLCLGHALAYGNAVLLCQKCNLSKGDKKPIDFYSTIELLRLQAYLDQQLSWRTDI